MISAASLRTMEVERKSCWNLVAGQDSRFRFYGGKLYGSINWVPADTVMNQEIGEKNDEGIGGLPEDVIRHVLDKIPEAKYLCNCSLVSKHFASLVLDTQKVSLKVPSWRPVCSCHQDPTWRWRPLSSRIGDVFNFLSKPFKFIWWLVRYPFRRGSECHYPDVITNKPPAIKNFLKKFSCIESLCIDLSFSGGMATPRYEPLVRWKCDNSGFVFVSAQRFDDGEVLGDVENVNGFLRAEAYAQLDLIRYHFMDAVWRLVFVESILQDFPHLKNVLVMDCMNQGRVVLDEEEILSLRDVHKPLEDKVFCCVRVWHLPVLELPLSARVVKEATLCIFKEVTTDDDLLVKGAFEEREYSELAMTMVKKSSFHQINVSASEANGRFQFVIG